MEIPLEEFQRVILEQNPLERENILQEIVTKYQVMYVRVLGKLWELLGEEEYQRIMNGKAIKKEIREIKEDIKDIKADVKDVQVVQESVREVKQEVREVVKEAVKEAIEEKAIEEKAKESAVVETKIQTQEKDLVKRVDFHDLRFCKIRRGTKKPYEADWPHKPYTWAEMQEHIKKELNYGVQCGYEGLIVIDADSKEVRDVVEKELPTTFKVETGSKGFHYYFICKEVNKKVVLQTDKHYGEIQSTGTQVVGPGCYSEDTEMLTLEGFKGIDQIKDTDKIATINKQGVIEYHFPCYIFKYDYEGKLIHFQNKSTDLLVTPNHRMYFKKYPYKKELIFQDAESLNPTFYIKRNGDWKGEDEKYFTPPLPDPIYKSENINRKRIDTVRNELINIPIDNWLDFLGWWLSEGSTEKSSSGYAVKITQIKKEYLKDIHNCLKNLKVKYSYNHKDFKFHSKQFVQYLKTFGNCKNKFVPAWIKNLPPKRQIVFLTSLFKGDGSFEKGKFRKYYTTSAHLRDDVLEMLLKCNLACSTHVVERKDIKMPKGNFCKYSKVYVITVGDSLYSKVTKKTKKDYKGRVWCVEVPNNTVFVIRNGKTAWCGNSLHPNGNYYTVVNDIPLAELTKEQLFSAMKPFMKDVAEEESRALEELKEQNKKYAQDSDINSIAITSVLSLSGFRKSSKGEYFGSNPWHGSSTGMNFWINPSKNVAKCWRCDCGLNVAKVIALENKIISTCSEKLTKSQFMEVLKIAQEKYGLVKMESQYQRSGMPNINKVISSFFSKEDLAEKLYNVQPYFYDKVKNWWLWNNNDKCWYRVDETDILNMTNLNSIADTIKAKDRVEILEAMKQEGRRRIPEPVKPTWIQFKDTIVDVAEGTRMTATPDYFVTNPIPWALHNDNCEDTPNMDRIFKEWVGEDFALLLFQIVAFCLLPDYPINRLFCFIGPGMNGKTKYLELLGKFIGKNNITSTELDILLDSRFEISRLHKKLVCVMGETNFAEMSKTSIIKKLTGGDLIGFEYKGKDPFDDKNYAKVLISTNNLPTTTDKTVGFYRRWLIIDFPNQFTEKIDILSQIPEEEYSCLANKCIKILKALLIDRKFHKEGSVEDRMKKFEDKSNPFDKFWKEFIEEDGSAYIFKYDFERKFNDWCRDNRFREFSETTIGLKMKDRGVDTIRRDAEWLSDGLKRKALRAWAGITWKNTFEKGEKKE